jgi:hypothetical protein
LPLSSSLLLKDHLHNFAVSLTFGVRHGVAVDVHRGLDAGVAHQLLLDGERRPGLIQPRPIAVPKRVPANRRSDLGGLDGFPDVALLDFLLLERLSCNRICEQPAE